MLDFCGKHNITCMTEKISMSYVNTAMERLIKNDVKYRFVIDIGNSLTDEIDIGNIKTDENAIKNTLTDKISLETLHLMRKIQPSVSS